MPTQELKCPYCSSSLPKMPEKKTKCKNCGKYYYRRSCPPEKRNYIIVTEDEKNIIEEEWRQFYIKQNSPSDDRKKIMELYKELDNVRNSIKIMCLLGNPENNEYYDSTSAEENRILRAIVKLKHIDDLNMN
ncbi:MAG: hypothetical protein KDC90_07080 [Ignavibacteriae bacterium]|nr:hypothetical protein [Ignavibacteriota bacterium]